MGIMDGCWVRRLEPLVDELRGLERGGDEVTLPGKDELTVLEFGTEDEFDERENGGEGAGEDGEEDGLEGAGNDNGGTEDDGKYDVRGGEEGEANVCPTPRRTRKTECRMDSQYRCTNQPGRIREADS